MAGVAGPSLALLQMFEDMDTSKAAPLRRSEMRSLLIPCLFKEFQGPRDGGGEGGTMSKVTRPVSEPRIELRAAALRRLLLGQELSRMSSKQSSRHTESKGVFPRVH